MGWRDGDKHHTKGGASRCGTVEIWRVEPRRFAKELMTAGLAVIKIQRTQRKMVLFSVLRVFLFAISAVKGS
jgi:hypothetical protein